jgi:hypothetical protein
VLTNLKTALTAMAFTKKQFKRTANLLSLKNKNRHVLCQVKDKSGLPF